VVDGSEFISHEFLDVLRKHRVKLRPNRARAPHLNGKVERSQQTDLVGGRNAPPFYALEIDGKGRLRRAKAPDEIAGRLAEWEQFYNEVRPHSGIGRKPPRKRWEEVAELTPTREELDARYDPTSEPRTVKRGSWYYVKK
jgi:transposase InsO family protein